MGWWSSWDAMLKTADFESEYILDVDMYQFIEKEVRGGVSYIAQRYNKFKNKRIEWQNYDKNKLSNCIIYEDRH